VIAYDETIAKLETDLGLTDGFFAGLAEEDDWSFVVKCHALMESACSYLLTAYFNNPSYADIFSRLEMTDKKKGKLAFLRATGMIVPEEASFIVALSELRNSLVHNIHRVPFRFSDHVSSLDKNQQYTFAKSFGYAYLDSNDNDKLVLKDSRPILSDPKSAILHALKLILAIILLQVETQRFKLEAAEQQKGIYEQVIANNRLHRIAETAGSR
jgi:hypothetical protein